MPAQFDNAHLNYRARLASTPLGFVGTLGEAGHPLHLIARQSTVNGLT